MTNFIKTHRPLVFLLVAFGVLILGALIWASRDKRDPGQATGPAAISREYICPMHPQIRQSKPGSCPICGMDLVLSGTEDDHSDEEHVSGHDSPEGHAPFRLSEKRQQMIGVKFGHVERKVLFKTIDAAGRVAYDPELYTAQNEYLEAVEQLERTRQSPLEEVRNSARRMVESAKLRLKILGLSDKQIARLRSEDTSGTNLLIPQPGESVWIYAEVFEMDLPFLKPGLEARISGGALGETGHTGKVTAVDRVINPTTRTARVRIELPNGSRLRPESFVDVTIRAPLGEQLSVPFDAVFDTGKESWVFVLGETGQFEPRSIAIKFRAGDDIAVARGVSENEAIVTSANFLIDSESRLKGVAARAKETGKAPPQCPPGEFWHAEMNHCMKKIGEDE